MGGAIKIQDTEIEMVDKYKYLGVWINEGKKYLEEHERHTITKGKRNSSIMKYRALWNFNKYEVVRGI